MNFCGLRSVRGNQLLCICTITVAGAEGVRDIGQRERDAVGLAGLERNGLFEALAEFAAERFAAHQLLIAAHGDTAVAALARAESQALAAL